MRKLSKVAALILAGVMVIGGVTGCSKNAGNSASTGVKEPSSTSDSQSTGSDVQELNMRAAAFGNNYDVQDMGWRWMMADCYEGLVRNVAGENGEEFILAGAEKIDISEDGLTYTFSLRKEAKWSDGKALTAYDYEYGWKRLINPENGYDYASFIFNIVGAEEYYNGEGNLEDVAINVIDDYTFEVTLKQADPTFQSKLVATPLYPTRQDIAEAAGDQWGSDWRLAVYNGPFTMTDLVEDNTMTWTKNEYYWDAENVKLDKINWFLVAEEATAATMFDNGQLDVLTGSGDYITKYNEKAESGSVQSVVTDYPGTAMLCYEFTNGGISGLMNNVKIRKAISYSLNRDEMISAVYGRYKPAYGLVAPAISFNESSYRSQSEEPIKAEYDQYAGNTEVIKALFQEGLDELGITTPISDITLKLLSYGSTIENQTEREYIQQVIENTIGCKVEQNTVGDYTLFKAQRDAYNYDIFMSAWYSDYNDPLDFFDIFYTGRYTSYGNYSNPEYDALIDSLKGENDMNKRLEIYKELENLLLNEDAACAPIYYADKSYFLQNWVKDFKTSSFGASTELYQIYIEGKN